MDCILTIWFQSYDMVHPIVMYKFTYVFKMILIDIFVIQSLNEDVTFASSTGGEERVFYEQFTVFFLIWVVDGIWTIILSRRVVNVTNIDDCFIGLLVEANKTKTKKGCARFHIGIVRIFPLFWKFLTILSLVDYINKVDVCIKLLCF